MEHESARVLTTEKKDRTMESIARDLFKGKLNSEKKRLEDFAGGAKIKGKRGGTLPKKRLLRATKCFLFVCCHNH